MKWTTWRFGVGSVLMIACSGSSGDGAGSGGQSESGNEAGSGGSVRDGGLGHEGGTAHSEGGVTTHFEAGFGADALGASDAGAACVPTTGTAVLDAFCGPLALAVMNHDGAATSLILSGSIQLESATTNGCVVVDGVDVMNQSTLVQHLTGSGSPASESAAGVLAVGTNPSADITNRCSSDDPTQRIDTYGVIVTGRANGGTFKASCAQAALGESWPPALAVTCHKNLDEPSHGHDVTVQATSFMNMTFFDTMASLDIPYGASGPVTAIDDGMYVIPALAPWDTAMPIPAFATTGWTATASPATALPYSTAEVEMTAMTNPFPSTLCPQASMGLPEAGAAPNPIFLGRITGTGPAGAFSTEAMFGGCAVEDIGSSP